MKSFHPYTALLALFGRGKPQRVAIAGKAAALHADLDSRMRDFWNWFQDRMKLGADRAALYEDYDSMDCDDIISAALDLYAEDATQLDTTSGKTVWIESKNKDIVKLGNRILDTVGMEDHAPAIARGLAKYGDYFTALLTGLDSRGRPVRVVGMSYRNPATMTRVEDELGRLRGFIAGSDVAKLDETDAADVSLSAPWDYIHFRLLGREEGEAEARYGTALIRSARRIYRYLSMMEESLTLYRIRRTPDRLKWTIDIGDAPPDEAQEILNTFRQSLRKKTLIDPQTGSVSMEMNPLALDEDCFLPKSSDSVTDVEVLAGSSTVGHVLDIEYMRKRLFSCLRIPPDYMGFSDAAGGLLTRSPLADQDVQFARQEKRIQRAIMTGVVSLVKINLIYGGIDTERDENEFRVCMCPVSFLDELQYAELLKVRAVTVDTLVSIGSKLKVDEATWQQYVLRSSGFPESVLNLVTQANETKEKLDETTAQSLLSVLQDLHDVDTRLQNSVSSLSYPLSFQGKLRESIVTKTEETKDD